MKFSFQVFELVNVLLSQRPTHNGVSMRVYKVVPLTQQSGLVEWCENTLPLGAYLAGNPVEVCVLMLFVLWKQQRMINGNQFIRRRPS